MVGGAVVEDGVVVWKGVPVTGLVGENEEDCCVAVGAVWVTRVCVGVVFEVDVCLVGGMADVVVNVEGVCVDEERVVVVGVCVDGIFEVVGGVPGEVGGYVFD